MVFLSFNRLGSQNQPFHTMCMYSYPKSIYHLSQSEIVDAHKIEVVGVLKKMLLSVVVDVTYLDDFLT